MIFYLKMTDYRMLETVMINAVYKESFGSYKGNPFIEALPDILEPEQVVKKLKGNIKLNHSDRQASSSIRAHLISQMMGLFFQPINRHIDLEKKTINYDS